MTTPAGSVGPHGTDGVAPDRMAPARQCTATSKSTGERCGHWAMRGGTVCRHHGGAAKQVRAKAAERRAAVEATADAERLLAHEATGRLSDPLEALSQLAVEALAMKDALAARVNALTSIHAGTPGNAEQLRAEVVLLERAMDRAAKFADMLVKHNWEEKRIQLEQAKADLVTAAFRNAVDVVDLGPADRDLVIRTFLRGIGLAVPDDEGPVTVRGELG